MRSISPLNLDARHICIELLELCATYFRFYLFAFDQILNRRKMRKLIPLVAVMSLLLYWARVSQAGAAVPLNDKGDSVMRVDATDFCASNCRQAGQQEGFMKSITRALGNHDDELGSSISSHRQSSNDQPANASDTSLSVGSRET
jgi:hypothetical protein